MYNISGKCFKKKKRFNDAAILSIYAITNLNNAASYYPFPHCCHCGTAHHSSVRSCDNSAGPMCAYL